MVQVGHPVKRSLDGNRFRTTRIGGRHRHQLRAVEGVTLDDPVGVAGENISDEQQEKRADGPLDQRQ